MIDKTVSENAIVALKLIYDEVKVVPIIETTVKRLKTEKQEVIYKSWNRQSFTKWNILNLIDYSKVILLDADQIVLRNIDELFELDAPAGTFSTPWWHKKPIYAAEEKIPERPSIEYGKITPDEIKKGGLDHGYVLIGAMVMVAPNADDYKKFVAWIESNKEYGHRNCISMHDEQSICEFFANKNTNFSYIPPPYSSIPWKYDWNSCNLGIKLPPKTFHYFNVEKPWDMKRGKWLDIEPWWNLAAIAVRKFPDLAKFFNADTLKEKPIKKCAYCEYYKLPDSRNHRCRNWKNRLSNYFKLSIDLD